MTFNVGDKVVHKEGFDCPVRTVVAVRGTEIYLSNARVTKSWSETTPMQAKDYRLVEPVVEYDFEYRWVVSSSDFDNYPFITSIYHTERAIKALYEYHVLQPVISTCRAVRK